MGIPLSPWDLPSGISPGEVGISKQNLIWSPVARLGWIEQASPACAAASVAGALNGLLHVPQLATDPNLSRDQAQRIFAQKHVIEVRRAGSLPENAVEPPAGVQSLRRGPHFLFLFVNSRGNGEPGGGFCASRNNWSTTCRLHWSGSRGSCFDSSTLLLKVF